VGCDEPVRRIPKVDDEIERDRVLVESVEVDDDLGVGFHDDYGAAEAGLNPQLAMLFLLLNAVGVAIQGASLLSLVSAMLPGDAASHMQAYSAEQLEGLAYLSISVYKTGFVTAQLFFGTWLFPLGYLVYKSGFLPRFLGVLLLLDGIAVLIWFLQAFLLPDYPAIRYPGLAVSFLAEVGLALWLLVKGVKVADFGAKAST